MKYPGKIILQVSRRANGENNHVCNCPGWRIRLFHDLGFGSIWECECGQRWKWIYSYAGEYWCKEGYDNEC